MDYETRIQELDELIHLLISLRKGKKIVHCHGVFDLLHIGHIKHFQEAKSMGEILVVTITPDRFVSKGPSRPIFSDMPQTPLTTLDNTIIGQPWITLNNPKKHRAILYSV